MSIKSFVSFAQVTTGRFTVVHEGCTLQVFPWYIRGQTLSIQSGKDYHILFNYVFHSRVIFIILYSTDFEFTKIKK